MNQRVWYVYTHRSDGLRREITYAGTWRWGRWRFRGVGSFPTLTAAQSALRKLEGIE